MIKERKIFLEKHIAGCGGAPHQDVSPLSAFSARDKVGFDLHVPRAIGAVAVNLTIRGDHMRGGGVEYEAPVGWRALAGAYDVYSATLDMERLGTGLHFIEYRIRTGDGEHVYPDAQDSQLLVYDADYETYTPKSGVIYHIFVDRFARSGRCSVKAGAVFNPDWDNGIPQYGERPGAHVENNVFFGGDLYGVIEKLDYIASLGASYIYLSPVFEAYSNHKYDTGNYEAVDSMFGGDDALRALIAEAKKRGIGIILDGVFNHTGSDSVYFNKNNTYDSVGAYQSRESKYYKWYRFIDWPDDYECWWGVRILPRVDCDNTGYRAFILGVISRWSALGCGWRLDVADELSDDFIEAIRRTVKSHGALPLIGEVWEDASDKVSYGKRRAYLYGRELDSVMNYPLREAVIAYVRDGDAARLAAVAASLYARYPKAASDAMMNLLGTHDTERLATVLCGEPCGDRPNSDLAALRMTPSEHLRAALLASLAYGLIAAMPGLPCIYYGDEVSLEGYRDPFCRRPFPWSDMGGEAGERLLAFYRRIGRLRRCERLLADGYLRIVHADPDVFAVMRYDSRDAIICAVNRSGSPHVLHCDAAMTDAFTGADDDDPTLMPLSCGYWKLTSLPCEPRGTEIWVE